MLGNRREEPAMIDPLRIATEGAACLAQLVNNQGRFRYRFDPDKPEDPAGYNILRHCGTIWAMIEISNRLGPLPEVAAAATRATERLIARNILPYRGGPARCVVGNDNVKLGGGGLAILALLEVAEASREARYLELACGLGEYILLQRRADGDFVHKRRYSTDEPTAFVSDYYT